MAGESNEFIIESIVELGPAGYAVERALGTARPDVLLLEATESGRDLPLAAAIHRAAPQVPLVGLASRDVAMLLGNNSSADFAAVATWPFTAVQLAHAIQSAVRKFQSDIYENLVAFLPGKAGSGASTVLLHSAWMVSRELKQRVLVMEGDLHSGLLSAMLRVEPKFPIRNVLDAAAQLDNLSWQRYVTTAGGVDFLLTNTSVKEPVPSWTHYFKLLRFAASKYDLIMADLPEVVNVATEEIVRRARAVYVVSTPEFASLKLSKQRCQELAHWGVSRERIRVLLNRGHKNDMGAKDAEKILECPVAATFPNDYKAVQRATADHSYIDQRSSLGESYLAFSAMLMGAEPEKKSFMGSFFKK
jgi:pilus assembly protein CpaE